MPLQQNKVKGPYHSNTVIINDSDDFCDSSRGGSRRIFFSPRTHLRRCMMPSL